MDFIFDGERLSEKGYMMCYDGVDDEELSVSSMVYDTIKASLSDVVHKVSHTYDENYTRTFAIMKSPCIDQEYFLTEDDISLMSKWLVRKQYKVFRYIDENEDEEEEDIPRPVWYKVQNTLSKINYGDNVIGLTVTVNANAPYGFADETTTTWSDDSKTIAVVTDEEGYIYPDMEITCNAAGNLTITNDRESGRITRINNVVADEVITITGGDIQQITSSVSGHDLSVDFNYVFPRLCSRYNSYDNTITTNLSSDKELSYCGIRKVGL